MKRHVAKPGKDNKPKPSPKQGQNPSQLGQSDDKTINRLRDAGSELERAVSVNFALTNLIRDHIEIQHYQGSWSAAHREKMSNGLFELVEGSNTRLAQAFDAIWKAQFSNQNQIMNDPKQSIEQRVAQLESMAVDSAKLFVTIGTNLHDLTSAILSCKTDCISLIKGQGDMLKLIASLPGAENGLKADIFTLVRRGESAIDQNEALFTDLQKRAELLKQRLPKPPE